MRNKLPILLALVLMAVAAMPWLRALESQRWNAPLGPTTVPPPQPILPADGSGRSPQVAERTRDTSTNPPAETTAGGPDRSGAAIPSGAAREKPAGTAGTASTPATSDRIPQVPDSTQPALPSPRLLLDCAVRSVEGRRYISSQVTQQGDLFGRQITGIGRYYEVREGPIPRIHLELTMEVDSVSTSLVQVCNGTTFWTYRKLPKGESLTKLDAIRAITALEKAAGRLPREAFSASPGLGGLSRLIRGMNAQFEFTAVVPDQLGSEPVWKILGLWQPAKLARLLPDQKEAIEKGHSFDTGKLPAHLPDSVTLYLSQDDCFPCRIEYWRSRPKAAPSRLMSIEFSEPNFNGPIDSNLFLFTPGSMEITDHTDEFVRALGE